MKQIHYLKGDATEPKAEGIKIIVHICNDIGGWGKGFVLAISKKWKEPKKQYREWFATRDANDFGLGEVQLVQVSDELFVCNMIAQHGIKRQNNNVPIKYEAVKECLSKVSLFAKEMCGSVHMPRIGCGLAGGRWDEIETIVTETLSKQDIETYVYDFE